MPSRKPSRRAFGQITLLPSGRYQARYTGPTLERVNAPITFTSKMDAEEWLIAERKLVERAELDPTYQWLAPKVRRARAIAEAEAEAKRMAVSTFERFAEQWLADGQTRPKPLKPRTVENYRRMLDKYLIPAFGRMPVEGITRADVKAWWTEAASLAPSVRSSAYGTLRTILNAAVDEELIDVNPARIKGAARVHQPRRIEPPTLEQLDIMVEAMPPKRRAIVLIAAWCGLRYGEIIELRRSDLDLDAGVIHVRRGVVRANRQMVVSTPKTAAGIRDVSIPPHLIPVLADHLETWVNRFDPDALLFLDPQRRHLATTTFYGKVSVFDAEGNLVGKPGHGWFEARRLAGREDLHFHDLRAFALTMAARAGATVGELQARAGHTTAAMAMRYQQASRSRDQLIAQRLSEMALGGQEETG